MDMTLIMDGAGLAFLVMQLIYRSLPMVDSIFSLSFE